MHFARTNASTTVDLPRIKVIGDKMRNLGIEMGEIFPERSALIQQLIYALLTRHHVMITGVYGTGKTDLLRTLFGCITGALTEGISFNKFMTESAIIGVPDMKELREMGTITYLREGSILNANFLELDEFLDASTPLQRILLGIIHERRFKRGRQDEKAKLHTAVASTNVNLEEAQKRDSQIGAVVDRFLFHCDVRYLQNSTSRRRMYSKYLAGEKPDSTISLEDLEYISSIVVDSKQINDPYFVEIYDQIIEAYCKKSKVILSDRRKCKLLEIIEANALMNGRYEPTFEDILSIRWGICPGHDEDGRTKFEATASPIIEKANLEKGQNIDQAQIMVLDQLEPQIVSIPDSCDDQVLLALGKQLAKLKEEVLKVLPQTDSTRVRQTKMMVSLDTSIKAIQDRLVK